jgi:hypothetical protein
VLFFSCVSRYDRILPFRQGADRDAEFLVKRKMSGLAVLACLSAVLAGTLMSATGASAEPRAATAAPAAHQLFGVSCASAKRCVATVSGPDLTAPALETWNGSRWAYVTLKQSARSTSSSLLGVACLSAADCLAVGDGYTGSADVALAYSGSGKTWAARVPQAAVAGLQAVSCAAAKCMALGFNAAQATIADLWNGSRWSEMTVPKTKGSVYYSLSAIACVRPRGCVAVGDANLNDNGYPVADTWTGAKWTASRLPMPSGTGNGSLYAVSCVSLTKCFATGGSETIKGVPVSFVDELNGTHWATVKLSVGSLSAVSCASAKSCLAVGAVGGDIIVDSGKARAEVWNGSAWKAVTVPAPARGAGKGNGSELEGVDCLSPADCTAVGLAGPAGGNGYGFSGFWNGKIWKLAEAA